MRHRPPSALTPLASALLALLLAVSARAQEPVPSLDDSTDPDPLGLADAAADADAEDDADFITDWLVYPIVSDHPILGMSFGLGAYHRKLFGDENGPVLRALALLSEHNTSQYQLLLIQEPYRQNCVGWDLGVQYFRQPALTFYGFGNETTLVGDSAEYGAEGSRVSVGGIFRAGVTRLGVRLTYNHRGIGDGSQSEAPDLSARYPGITGVDGEAAFALSLSLIYDTTPTRLESPTPGHGTRLAIGWRGNEEALSGSYSLHVFSASASNYATLFGAIPTDYPRLVLATHAEVAIADRMSAPFFALPSLGGDSLRGYAGNRFIGQAAVAAQVEARLDLFAWEGMFLRDVALVFYADAGRVFTDRDRVGIDGTRFSLGGGVRLSASNRTIFRIEAATGFPSEGLVFFVRTSGTF